MPSQPSSRSDEARRRRPFPTRGQIIPVGVAIAALLFVWFRRSDLAASVGVLSQVRLAPLAIAVALSGLAVVNRGALNRAAHRAVGMETGIGSMTRVSAAAYALNKVVKSGGVGGIALFVKHGERRQHSAGKITAAYMLASSCAQIALLTLVMAAIGGAAITGALTGAWLMAAAVFASIATLGLASLALSVRSQETIKSLYALPHQLLASIATRAGRDVPEPPDPVHAETFFTAAESVRRTPRSVVPVLGHAVAAKLLGAAVLAASLAATGATLSLANVLTVYALALIAATVGILPGGIGAVEASMASLLGTFGLAAPVAIAAVLTFRLLDLWFPLGVGLVASRNLTRQASSEPTAVSQELQLVAAS